MAFARSGLCRIGGSGTGGSTWQYSTADAKAAIVTSGYMNYAYDKLALGDVSLVLLLLPHLQLLSLMLKFVRLTL